MTLPAASEMTRLLDRVKTEAFVNSNGAFLGSLLCQLKGVIWNEQIPTACTNSITLEWNPYWFLSIPEPTRKTVLMHELWHVGLMHQVRRGNRDPEIWNEACDHYINLKLKEMKYTFDGTDPLCDDKYRGMHEEAIYDDLIKNPSPKPKKPNGFSNDLSTAPPDPLKVVTAVVAAKQAAALSGQAGTLPGSINDTLEGFLKPKLPWEQLLYRWMEELSCDEYSWRHRNRRFPNIYMPGTKPGEGGLSHLIYFLDVSGSIEDEDVRKFNSEVKYIKDNLEPERLTLVLFDTKIHEVFEFYKDDPFDAIHVAGRGGTSLTCVREYIEEHKPTAAVIFSDLECKPMKKPKHGIPVLWVRTRPQSSYSHVPSYGKLIDLH